MPGLKMAIGLILIFAGCQIPWFFVGAAGLLLGDFIALYVQNIEKTWDILVHDLKYGVLGSLVAFLHKRTATIIAGGLYSAFLVRNLPAYLGWNMDWFSWQHYVIAAAIGILLVYFVNTLAIVTISTFSGAVMVAQYSDLGAISPWFTLVSLIVLGIATQFILLRYYNPEQDNPTT